MSFKEKSTTFEDVYHGKYQKFSDDFVINVVKMSLNCLETIYINDINDQISFQAISIVVMRDE